MWREAVPTDDTTILDLFTRLYTEDPSTARPGPGNLRRTLDAFRADPRLGRALVCDLGQGPVGYALLARFWSNELGGEVCAVDELCLGPSHRGQGHGAALFAALDAGQWFPDAVALTLEVTAHNPAAERLYRRLGFSGDNRAMRRPTARGRAGDGLSRS
jgi:RimJ/RimL family protein N-acetyltransferase